MHRVLMLYAPRDGSARDSMEKVSACFESERFVTHVRSAHGSSVADICASDILIIGVRTEDGIAVPPDFVDISRALAGINLAGRMAGIVSIGSQRGVAGFETMLRDSEIGIVSRSLVYDDPSGQEEPDVCEWVQQVIAEFEEFMRPRLA